MKKCLAIAALLLASTAAQAQYTFDYGGRTIRVDPDRGTVSIPGVYDNSGRKAKRSRNEDGDRDRPRKQSPQQAKTDPQTAPYTTESAMLPLWSMSMMTVQACDRCDREWNQTRSGTMVPRAGW